MYDDEKVRSPVFVFSADVDMLYVSDHLIFIALHYKPPPKL